MPRLGNHLPSWKNVLLALLAAGLLVLAFPDFEWWWTAWFALVPLMWSVERQKHCITACVLLGWLFGTVFFFGTCWWLAYAPIHYASFPPLLAYSLILIACLGAGIFPGIFTLMLAILLRRFGSKAFLAAPFVWVFSEFARYWITGNNWNAIGYSQAFDLFPKGFAEIGGVLFTGFACGVVNCTIYSALFRSSRPVLRAQFGVLAFLALLLLTNTVLYMIGHAHNSSSAASLLAVQPNVPMSGLNNTRWQQLRQRQIDLAKTAISDGILENRLSRFGVDAIILPESPMNFMYSDDREFQEFINDFARENHVSVLFNSSEPDVGTTKYFNSAVMIGPDGNKVAEYDKIFLLPFGEAVPAPFDSVMPAFVGSFSYGSNYALLPVGEAKAGVMICFESHFGQLSREYVRQGADVIIEMTNDGYLGPTPVLRQHLANAVFRAVETNRPVLRVTNVGITTYIDERGNVLDPTMPYQEDTRVWSVSKSDGSQTFYVRYGDWFAWLCAAVTVGLLIITIRRKSPTATNNIA